MHSLDIIILKNAEAAGRELAESDQDLEAFHNIEQANDEAVYGDPRLDVLDRSALQGAYHRAFEKEAGLSAPGIADAQDRTPDWEEGGES